MAYIEIVVLWLSDVIGDALNEEDSPQMTQITQKQVWDCAGKGSREYAASAHSASSADGWLWNLTSDKMAGGIEDGMMGDARRGAGCQGRRRRLISSYDPSTRQDEPLRIVSGALF